MAFEMCFFIPSRPYRLFFYNKETKNRRYHFKMWLIELNTDRLRFSAGTLMENRGTHGDRMVGVKNGGVIND